MANRCVVVILFISAILMYYETEAISFKDIKKKITEGKDIANDLLGERGEIPREAGCSVKWDIQGTIRGIKWKWICTCRDTCTGITEVHTKSSRDGALPECFVEEIGKGRTVDMAAPHWLQL